MDQWCDATQYPIGVTGIFKKKKSDYVQENLVWQHKTKLFFFS